jgi:hypothetical protein
MRLLEAALRNARGALGTGWPPHDNASRGEDEQRGSSSCGPAFAARSRTHSKLEVRRWLR